MPKALWCSAALSLPRKQKAGHSGSGEASWGHPPKFRCPAVLCGCRQVEAWGRPELVFLTAAGVSRDWSLSIPCWEVAALPLPGVFCPPAKGGDRHFPSHISGMSLAKKDLHVQCPRHLKRSHTSARHLRVFLSSGCLCLWLPFLACLLPSPRGCCSNLQHQRKGSRRE